MPHPLASRAAGAFLIALAGLALFACADPKPLTPEQQHYLDVDRQRFPIGVYQGF